VDHGQCVATLKDATQQVDLIRVATNPLHSDELDLIDLASFGIDLDSYLAERSEGVGRAEAILDHIHWRARHATQARLQTPTVLVLSRPDLSPDTELRLDLDPDSMSEYLTFYCIMRVVLGERDLPHPGDTGKPPALWGARYVDSPDMSPTDEPF